jgi:transcription elongation GreA/GreB family factor
MLLDKKRLVEEILVTLNTELTALVAAAQAAHLAATHEESKAEDQYDTRGLEASYLAVAQSERASQIERVIAMYKALPLQSHDTISAGSLIELQQGSRKSLYFLVAQGGGLSLNLEGKTVNVITPAAPLGEELNGRKAGETIEVEIQNQFKEFKILKVE